MKSSFENFRSRARNGLMVGLMALFSSVSVSSTLGEGIQIGANVTVRFSDVEAGREVLTRRDEFIAALTPLDRRADADRAGCVRKGFPSVSGP